MVLQIAIKVPATTPPAPLHPHLSSVYTLHCTDETPEVNLKMELMASDEAGPLPGILCTLTKSFLAGITPERCHLGTKPQCKWERENPGHCFVLQKLSRVPGWAGWRESSRGGSTMHGATEQPLPPSARVSGVPTLLSKWHQCRVE